MSWLLKGKHAQIQKQGWHWSSVSVYFHLRACLLVRLFDCLFEMSWKIKHRQRCSNVQSIYCLDIHAKARILFLVCVCPFLLACASIACFFDCLLACFPVCLFIGLSVGLSVLLWLQTRSLSSKMECSGLDLLIYKQKI